MKLYGKFWGQIAVTVLGAVVAALTDNVLDTGEIINVIIIGLGAFGVLGAGEFPSGVWSQIKPILAGVSAVFALLASVIIGGLTTSEIIQLALAFAGAIGISAVPGPKVQPTAGRLTA